MFKKVRRVSKEIMTSIYNACFNQTYGTVMMLHRIGPEEPDRLPVIAELNVTPQYLQRFVDQHRKNYDFISVDEVVERMNNPQLRKRKFIAFTFDDGYRDNLTYGLPFFEKNNIPFAVFLTTDFINRRPAFNYSFILERIIANNDKLILDGQTYMCDTLERKNHLFIGLKHELLALPYHNFEEAFTTMFSNYYRPEYAEDLTLTWDEVRQLAASPLCTIGSHTVTHCRLSNCSTEELRYELGQSKKQIESQINREVKHISYPYGYITDVNQQVLDVSSELYAAGYQSFMGGGTKERFKSNVDQSSNAEYV